MDFSKVYQGDCRESSTTTWKLTLQSELQAKQNNNGINV